MIERQEFKMNRSRSFWTFGVISDIVMIIVETLILMFKGQDIKFTILEYSIVITVVYRFLTRCARYSLRKEGLRLIKCTVLENQGNRRVKYVYNANDLKDNKLKNRVDNSSILVMTRYEKLRPGENVDVLMSSNGERLRELPIKHTMTADLTVLIVLTLLTVGCFVKYLV